MDTYDFTITIGFRVEADTEYDALSAAYSAEDSLNEASLTRSTGGHANIVRSRAPRLTAFRKSGKKMSVVVAHRDMNDRVRNTRLNTLLQNFRVTLTTLYKGDRTYGVSEPNEERAIQQAKVLHYHDTSTMSPDVVSVVKLDK